MTSTGKLAIGIVAASVIGSATYAVTTPRFSVTGITDRGMVAVTDGRNGDIKICVPERLGTVGGVNKYRLNCGPVLQSSDASQ